VKRDSNWTFIQRAGRPPLTREEADELIHEMNKVVKCGIEFELNLPEKTRGCPGDNPKCKCINISKIDGKDCYESCSRKGTCDIEKATGCPEEKIYCVLFRSICDSCTKFDRGCKTCKEKAAELKSPDQVRKEVFSILKPTKFLGQLGKFGVLDVVQDGSLQGNGGLEVVTVGRRVNFHAIHNMCKKILSVAKDYGAFTNERCSVHFHLLSGYLGTSNKYNSHRPNYGLNMRSGPGTTDGVPAVAMPVANGGGGGQKLKFQGPADTQFEIRDLEKEIPEVVLANFHQLWRMFENAIIWLTSSGARREHLTRWIKFRKSLLKYSAFRCHMSGVVEEIRKETENARYTMVNYVPIRFDSDGNISQFHLEVRVCDGMLSPAATSAFACLFYGMLMKSIDISRFGIVESGGKEWMDQARNISKYLCNNDGAYGGPRHSDTSGIDPYIPVLVSQSKMLLKLVKPYLLEHPPSYDILNKLTEQPISLRLSEGASWEAIENSLYPESPEVEDDTKNELMKTISLNLITECSGVEEWVSFVAEELKLDKKEIEKNVGLLTEAGRVFWSPSLGAIVKR
jgi:hypothetical protein